jgi:hypothetical protein
MPADGQAVEHPGKVVVESHAVRGGDTPPEGQRILHDAGGGHAGFGGKAEIAGMAFRVVLNEIRADALQQMAGHGLGQIAAKHSVFFRGVQVEMEAEKAVLALEPSRRGGCGAGEQESGGCGKEFSAGELQGFTSRVRL